MLRVRTALPAETSLLLLACAGSGSPSPDGGMDGAPAPDAPGLGCTSDRDCSDRIACTVEHCADGVCSHEPCIDCCPDGLACVVGLGCRTAPEPCTEDADCVDESRCTIDRCRDSDFCEHLPQDELCDEGESCFPALGCIPSPPESCGAADECTGGRVCLGEWSCQPEFGCQFVTPPDCDDEDECTVDGCDDDMGGCTHALPDTDGDGHGDGSCGGDDCADEDPTVHPDAIEICNGVDDDCDGTIDESCCTEGLPCTTSCGSPGTSTCTTDGSVGPCAPPAEACNGADDDCDAMVDEDFPCTTGAGESCATSCGSAGMRSCLSDCTWGACVPPVEMCNGTDDDCDAMVDEGFACRSGATGSCPTSCGSTGSRTCLGDCSWDSCVPPTEVCNGVDDDCDSVCDDGFTCCSGATRACSTLGFFAGTAVCRTSCASYDTTGCTNCGNGTLNSGEQCDGAALGGNDCTTVPGDFGSGTLDCTSACTFDTSRCSLCGNGTLDSGEQCDGSALGGNTCTSIPGGYTGGTLGCTSACTFNTSMCVTFDPSGIYDGVPTASYSCVGGLVNYSYSVFTFTDDGVTLSVTGARCTMTGPSARISRMISVSCTESGGCDETYTLMGTFTTDDTWTGTFSSVWTPLYPGACGDCVDQVHPMTGTRR